MTPRRKLVWIAIFALVVAVGCGRESGGRDSYVAQARQIVQDLDGGRYGAIRERFDNKLMGTVSEDHLAKAWQNLTDLKGRLLRVVSTPVVESGGFTVVNVELQFEREGGQVRVSFNGDGRVAGFFFFEPMTVVPER